MENKTQIGKGRWFLSLATFLFCQVLGLLGHEPWALSTVPTLGSEAWVSSALSRELEDTTLVDFVARVWSCKSCASNSLGTVR